MHCKITGLILLLFYSEILYFTTHRVSCMAWRFSAGHFAVMMLFQNFLGLNGSNKAFHRVCVALKTIYPQFYSCNNSSQPVVYWHTIGKIQAGHQKMHFFAGWLSKSTHFFLPYLCGCHSECTWECAVCLYDTTTEFLGLQ